MAKKFKDTLDDYRKLSSSIKSKLNIAPVYLLMGEEAYFIDKLEESLRTNLLSDDERDFNENIMYGSKELSWGEIVASAHQCPVMADRVLIIVREAQNIQKIEQLLQYVQSPMKTSVLVICYKGKTVDRRLQVCKAIEKNGVIFESVSPRMYEMMGIPKAIAATHNLVLDDKSEAMLLQYVGANLMTLDNELQKLSETMPSNQRNVSDKDIEQKIGISREYNVYELTQSLSECDYRKALTIATNFASNPKQTPTQIIFPVLYSHFQRILSLGVIMWTARKQGTQIPSDLDIAKKMGLPNVFFIKEYKQALAKYTNKKVFTILGLIRSYDMQTKGVGYNSSTDHELLRELIIKIMSLK